jgi:MiaB/RimO family radical SAM methylthiotransferase
MRMGVVANQTAKTVPISNIEKRTAMGNLGIRIYICTTTTGCEINHYHTTKTQAFFRKNGYVLVQSPEDATDILVMTCGVLQATETKSIRVLQDLISRFPNKRIRALGCLPAMQPDLPVLDGVPTLGPKSLPSLSEVYPCQTPYDQISIHRVDHDLVGANDLFPNRYTILVAQGCLGSCTYCAIKKAKGKVTSKSIEQVVACFREICEQHDSPQIALLADDLGSYGVDRQTDAVQLLDELTQTEGDYTIEIQNFEPSRFLSLYDRFEPILARDRITKIHVALQSGSQSVLKAMNRRYDVKHVVQVLTHTMARYPDLLIETSFIVNFPGETREDFSQTLRLLPLFDEVMVFDFSPRHGTKAASLENIVSPDEKRVRLQLVQKLATAHKGLTVM